MSLFSILKTLLISILLIAWHSAYAVLHLTQIESEWIKSHKEVTYTFKPAWPLEYNENGQHVGLSRAYLDVIEKSTGLRFVAGQPDESFQLYTNLVPALMPNIERDKWRASRRWLTSNTLIIATPGASNIRTLDLLKGKRVAVLAGSWSEFWLKEHYPDILLFPFKDVGELFESISLHEVEAGIGSDLVLKPLLNRNFSHQLVVAGQIPAMVAGIHMGVSADSLILLNILNKALSSIPVSQTDTMFKHWVGDIPLGSPTMGVILSLYSLEIGLFVFLFIVLIGLLHRSIVMKRRAVTSEQHTSQFLAMMSHEIRTPMNALIAALELIRLPCSAKRRDEYVELACHSSDNLLILLDNILDHSKLTQNRIQLGKHCFSINLMSCALVAAYQPLAIQKGLTIELIDSLTAENEWIISDEHRLRQVVANLVSNAIKFTENGGVKISLYWMSDENADDLLCIDVTDSGIGISSENQRKLFSAWSQLDNSLTRRYDGSGLGLFISHQLIKLAGGSLQCKSQPGAGSTFRVQIPVERCSSPVSAAPSLTLPRFAEENRILIVEDHAANQKMLGAQLEQLGCYFDIAPDGMTALHLIKENNKYDIMLLDCNLPDIDGYEVARKVRLIEAERGFNLMPIIAVSAMSGEVHRERCDACGITAQLTKPISLKMLGKILSQWCEVSFQNLGHDNSLSDLSENEFCAYLLQDIEGFSQAISDKCISAMLHYAHRVKGAAQMYSYSRLASLAEDIEVHLRLGKIPSFQEGGVWLESLRAELFSITRL